MRKIKQITLATIIGFTSIFTVKAMDDARLMRFPDINKNLVAFVYAGDIWTVDANGGDAKRLTSHKGLELFPKISPDGQWIAFSAEYSGSRQVYIMPATGGTPEQLTWYNDVGVMPPRGGYDRVILDWSPDSKKVLVRMNRTPFGERNGRYYFVDINGGQEEPLAITESKAKFNISANLAGGGLTGQAGALRLGISKALLKADENFKDIFRKNGYLTRDPRMKERKKYGQKGARKRFQWTKR